MVVLVVGVGAAIAAHATDPSKQTDAPMQKKMQKNEPSTQTPAQQKSRGTPDDGMKSKPTHKGDKGQTDPLEQGGRSPSTSRDSSTGAGQ
jgi:hypothetical protein